MSNLSYCSRIPFFLLVCPHQTDLMLVNLDEEDNVSHMIEGFETRIMEC